MLPSSILPDRVKSQIASLIPEGAHLLVGLSGGVDSVVLLHLLSLLAPEYLWEVSAIHVHHGISKLADDWVCFCQQLCNRLNIPLVVESVNIEPLRSLGIEAAARKLRFEVFSKFKCDVVALAHHIDDQSETILLQLLRGAGVRGASAMPFFSVPSEPLKKGDLECLKKSIVRPLLNCTRREIVDYAVQHQLQWIEDDSNRDESYPRNFLRHRIFPVLGEKFPAYRETLARSAQHFAEANDLLDELAQQDSKYSISPQIKDRLVGDITLDIALLQLLSTARAKNLLRYFFHCMHVPMPQAVQLDEILMQLCHAREDAKVSFTIESWQIKRYLNKVFVVPIQLNFDKHTVISWQGESQLKWPALNRVIDFKPAIGVGISTEKLNCAPVSFRFRQGGEVIRLHEKSATRTLKNLFQEAQIPPWRRDRIPIMYCGNDIVCVLGVAVAAEFQSKEGESSIKIHILE